MLPEDTAALRIPALVMMDILDLLARHHTVALRASMELVQRHTLAHATLVSDHA